MASQFLRRFASEFALTSIETEVLATVDVQSYADVDSVVRWFPRIAELGVRLSYLSNLVSERVSGSYSEIAHDAPMRIRAAGMGANPPPGGPWTSGSPPRRIPPSGGPPSPPGRIDLRISPWPVRDQGERRTCVAFSSAACVELEKATTAPLHLSAQFHYWAIKNAPGEPNPGQDGTFLAFARRSLAQDGICDEQLWPYDGTLMASITHGSPSQSAINDAQSKRIAAATYGQSPGLGLFDVFAALQRGRPVAISLPVFADTLVTDGTTNWTAPVGWSYGRVLNPPPTSVVRDGHAVCIVGFEPDPDEPCGGYFICRNSWGTRWAQAAPSGANSRTPEPGYGEISATYVDTFLWELLQL
jgi:hypothetical protein